MKKVTHILYSGLGGTTDYVFNLIKADIDSNFEHHIVFYGVEQVPNEQLALANNISKSVNYIHKKKGYDRNSIKTISNLLNKSKPQTIVLHVNSLIFTCAKFKNAKIVFVEHQANHLKTKKEWLWSLIAQIKADYIVSFTEEYLKKIKTKLPVIFKKEKNIIIATGIELNLYSKKKTKKDNIIRFGIISRINNFRDHKTLLKAFTALNLSNCKLYIAGDGPLKDKLEQKYEAANINWLGTIGSEEIINLLTNIDIYVIASFGESTSIALMQAQASGLPVIASNVNGINNVLDSENCLFVEPRNVNSYKDKIKQLIESQITRKKLGEKSLEYAQNNLSHFRMFDEYKRIL